MDDEYEKVEVDEEVYRKLPYPYNVTTAKIDGIVAGMVAMIILSFANIGALVALAMLGMMIVGKFWIQRNAEKEEKTYVFRKVP